MIGVETRLVQEGVLIISHAKTTPPSCMNGFLRQSFESDVLRAAAWMLGRIDQSFCKRTRRGSNGHCLAGYVGRVDATNHPNCCMGSLTSVQRYFSKKQRTKSNRLGAASYANPHPYIYCHILHCIDCLSKTIRFMSCSAVPPFRLISPTRLYRPAEELDKYGCAHSAGAIEVL